VGVYLAFWQHKSVENSGENKVQAVQQINGINPTMSNKFVGCVSCASVIVVLLTLGGYRNQIA